MAVEHLSFQGINRAVSDFAANGACEELINLRPTTAGLVPVKPFLVKMSGLSYDKIFVHNASNTTNYLGVAISGGILEVAQLDESGSAIGAPIISEEIGDISLDNIHFAAADNIVLFSISDEEKNVYQNYSLIWKTDSYAIREADIPDITMVVSGSDFQVFNYKGPAQGNNPTQTQITEIINSGLNAIQEQNKEYCIGPILIALAFKMNDGRIFWTHHWQVYNPISGIKNISKDPPLYVDDTWQYASSFRDFFDAHPEGGYLTSYDDKVFAGGGKVTVRLSMDNPTGWNETTSMLKAVEIYASKPQAYVDPGKIFGQSSGIPSFESTTTVTVATLLPGIPLKDMELEGQLLYHQKSVSLKDLSAGAQEINLEFGGNIQTTNTTLLTDAGAVTRFGNILSYNSRFHLFDSVAKNEISMPFFSSKTSYLPYSWDVFIRYDDGMKESLFYAGTVGLASIDLTGEPVIIASSLNVKEVIIYREDTVLSITHYYLRKFSMVESTRYNFSINVTGSYSRANKTSKTDEMNELLEIKGDGTPTTALMTSETNAINVTEQINPFVFNVDHSYLAPGKILDVQPQMVAVEDVDFGDYPLNIFTNRGVYALLQGTDTTLYRGFKFVSNLVSESNSVPTESGTFFIAAGGLWLVAGNRAILVSHALSLGPHDFIRSSEGYRAIANGFYNISSYESAVSFETFLKGAVLLYNRYRDEIIVSNPKKDYSYVLSLKFRQWFKIAQSLSQDVIGSSLARTGNTMVDFSDEQEDTNQLVHLQSRPFTVAYQYSHIHRVVAMIRAKLARKANPQTHVIIRRDTIAVALYGSDDLQEWKLLCYADRQGPVKFSQVRTPSAARSWRYYTITIGGEVPEDTDFGPILVDYEPVIRRIG